MKKTIKKAQVFLFVLIAAFLLLVLVACQLGDSAKLTVTFDCSHQVYEGDNLDSIKPYLNVTYTDEKSDVIRLRDDEYILSGALQQGECTITVEYNELTCTVKINVLQQRQPTLGLEYTLSDDGNNYIVSGIGITIYLVLN